MRQFARRFSNFRTVVSPYSGETVAEVEVIDHNVAQYKLQTAASFQKVWQDTALEERIDVFKRAMGYLTKNSEELAKEVTMQMGKPLQQARNEIRTMNERAEAMIDLAPKMLADHVIEDSPGRLRMIRKEPVGVVLQISPWNYPYITTINALSAAVLAGNTLLLKHSSNTPLVGQAFAKAFAFAGAGEVVQDAFMSYEEIHDLIQHQPEIGYVTLVGSTEVGRQLYKTVAEKRFIDIGLELGGKDCAYIAKDADPKAAAEGALDGALYNAGQSCCAIERIYVQEEVYDDFLHHAEQIVKSYVLGDPLVETTNMGPLTDLNAPSTLSDRVTAACENGAQLIYGGVAMHDEAGKGNFMMPTLITNLDEEHDLFAKESFGPIVAVSKVKSVEEAVIRMNTNEYGLTNAIYTQDRELALDMAGKLESGTVFMNKCDYVDPYLGWTGYKNTGKGTSLSHHGFNFVTRPKSFNFVG